ncbi:MAG: hypothetical protein ACFFCS_02170 [Candidatus Hodarchaeota archaeon]
MPSKLQNDWFYRIWRMFWQLPAIEPPMLVIKGITHGNRMNIFDEEKK